MRGVWYLAIGAGHCVPVLFLINNNMSPPRGPIGGGGFIVARRGTIYVTHGPYLPIAKGLTFMPIF